MKKAPPPGLKPETGLFAYFRLPSKWLRQTVHRRRHPSWPYFASIAKRVLHDGHAVLTGLSAGPAMLSRRRSIARSSSSCGWLTRLPP